MGGGCCTNTRYELLALWVLLVFSPFLGMPYINIRGDSYAVVNWFNGQATRSTLELDGWCQLIRDLQSFFIHLHTAHVYREYNVKADSLSKEALHLASGSLHFMEFTEGECIGMGTFQLI